MSINNSISNVRSFLGSPKSQAPTLDQLFTNLTAEFQGFMNELETTNLPWTYQEQTVSITNGQNDYILNNVSGKVLFVVAYPQDTALTPIALEFADLADVSSNFWLYSPLDYGYSRDFNEAITWPFASQIAFYRKDNSVYFRLAPFGYTLSSIKVTFSTGDWLADLTTESTAVLQQHHALPEVRSALNLLPSTQWGDDPKMNQENRVNYAQSLQAQEARYARNFMYGRRNMTADQVNERVSSFGGW